LLSSILFAVSKRVNHQSFNTWFRPISVATRDDSIIYLQVPSEMFRDWITNNYFDVLEESLHELNLDDCKVSFPVEEKQHPPIPTESTKYNDPGQRQPRRAIPVKSPLGIRVWRAPWRTKLPTSGSTGTPSTPRRRLV
jgi:chromosomal replication initiation ATPase DnaA